MNKRILTRWLLLLGSGSAGILVALLLSLLYKGLLLVILFVELLLLAFRQLAVSLLLSRSILRRRFCVSVSGWCHWWWCSCVWCSASIDEVIFIIAAMLSHRVRILVNRLNGNRMLLICFGATVTGCSRCHLWLINCFLTRWSFGFSGLVLVFVRQWLASANIAFYNCLEDDSKVYCRFIVPYKSCLLLLRSFVALFFGFLGLFSRLARFGSWHCVRSSCLQLSLNLITHIALLSRGCLRADGCCYRRYRWDTSIILICCRCIQLQVVLKVLFGFRGSTGVVLQLLLSLWLMSASAAFAATTSDLLSLALIAAIWLCCMMLLIII